MNKKHIIEEIIRTAKENNGVPLGINRFEKETGIKPNDWYGKYWARWGDAIKEAGFKPNKLQSAYTEEYIVQHVISLIKEINRFPTTGEFRLKAHRTQGFPAHTTIKRLGKGKKHALIKKILNYCQNKPKYKNIIEICEKALPTKKEESKNIPEENNASFGFVYLMRSGRFYKIGRASGVEKRNYEIGIKLPEELETIHKIQTDDPSGIESYWHKRFSDKRKKGEWFDLSLSDIRAFKRRKFM